MRVAILSNYFYPETVGTGVAIYQLARDLEARHHHVTVITSFPSYPEGRIAATHRGHLHLRERVEGIDVIRTYTYATPSRQFWPRLAGFGAFCTSSVLGGLAEMLRADVVYAILPPLPLGVSGCILAHAAHAPLVVNIQDIYPDIAVTTGFLKNAQAIRFFQGMERWIYRRAERIVVISEGFRQNLAAKGVPVAKIAVVSNWADPEEIRPGVRQNGFRKELGINGEFLVLYSGGLTHNSHLWPVLEAARRLAAEPFVFVIAGEGVQKEHLQREASRLALRNVRFLPFQPLKKYPDVLAAADATLVTLNRASTFASVPSKIYKQMAAARPVIAITEPGNEISRLIERSRCGVQVTPDDSPGLADALRAAAAAPADCERMGRNGREYVVSECSRSRSVAAIESVLLQAAGRSAGAWSSAAST